METRKAKNAEGSKVSYVGNLVDKATHFIKNPDELNNILNEAFNRASVESENKAIRKMSEMVQTLFRMTKASFSGEYTELSKGKVFLGLAAIAYFIAPKDMLPDKIPFLGVLDDMVVLAWFIKAANEEITKFKAWEGTEFTSTNEVSPAY
jgi:uncharacterized membrane protein YkvA (DUF1232 family)